MKGIPPMSDNWWARAGVVVKLLVVSLVALLIAVFAAVIVSPKAEADSLLDPYVPIPALQWCPGGGGQGAGWGGYCDGMRYADGSFWHSANVLGFWTPTQCVIDNGTALPPPAPRGGCGVVLR